MLAAAASTTRASQASARRRSRPREDDDAFLARLEALARSTIYAVGTRKLAQEDARRLVDLAVKLACGRGLDDLTIGEGLAALRAHDIKLGYNGLGDLAREEFGTAPAHARWLAGLAEKLAARPLLRAAVVAGALSLRKADAVVDAAVGEHEAYWVERAKHDTVVRLEAAAKPGAQPAELDWRLLRLLVAPPHREQVAMALSTSATVLGNLDAPVGHRISVLSMEWLGEFPLPEDAATVANPRGSPEAISAARRVVAEAAARASTSGGRGPPYARHERIPEDAPTASSTPTATPTTTAAPAAVASPTPPTWPRPARPRKLLRALKRLVKDHVLDDERLGRACLLVRVFAAWKVSGARCFEAFCVEQLGMAPSTVRQRMKLEHGLQHLPPLREALRSGKLSYEQARAVARVATPADVEARIEAAAGKPCIDTQRDTQEETDRQMWRKGRIRAPVSATTDELFAAAVRSARLRVPAKAISVSEALYLISVHFNAVWLETATRLEAAAHPVMKRARGRCQVPGCSHRASHLHHVRYRSRGGPNAHWNLTAVCAAHHLAAIHQGYVTVTGTAPDGLVWEFPWRDRLDALDADQRAVEGLQVAW